MAIRLKLLMVVAVALSCVLNGCVSVPIQDTELLETPPEGSALVTFVRTKAYPSAAYLYELYDGDEFIGPIRSGSLAQYVAQPGEHLFMGRTPLWSFLEAELLPDKHYFVLVHTFPVPFGQKIIFSGVWARSDDKLNDWLTELTPVSIPEDKYLSHVEKRSKKAREVMERYNEEGGWHSNLFPEQGL